MVDIAGHTIKPLYLAAGGAALLAGGLLYMRNKQAASTTAGTTSTSGTTTPGTTGGTSTTVAGSEGAYELGSPYSQGVAQGTLDSLIPTTTAATTTPDVPVDTTTTTNTIAPAATAPTVAPAGNPATAADPTVTTLGGQSYYVLGSGTWANGAYQDNQVDQVLNGAPVEFTWNGQGIPRAGNPGNVGSVVAYTPTSTPKSDIVGPNDTPIA